MNKEWLKIFIAAFFEVGWVIGLKHADDLLSWVATIIAIAISFYLLIMAGKTLPAGTAYAVFVGLGTAGTVISDLFLFNEPFHFGKVTLIFTLLIGVIGLKQVTGEGQSSKGADA
ncbi:DMT family transporter [Thalassobacillus hwangdonensis]|uniref:DMT family transporter n=1 Tax=Thalassobacillus hwangdonensis TaxID=546108 RepID=A0ABW3KZI6_9BACI